MKILLVDDEADVRFSISKFLTSLGHQVIECDNGKNALNLLKNEKIHLVLSDIKMPLMDGNELLKQIKKSDKLKNTAVVLFTGYGEVKGAVKAMRYGAYDYILKPIDVNELAAIIEKVSQYMTLKKENIQLKVSIEHLKEATEDLKEEFVELKKAYAREVGTGEIGLFSNKIRQVFIIAQKLHRNPEMPVLIEGETGTGKEIIARFIHFGRGDVVSQFVGINCAAITPTLFESELFGYEAGSFTGGRPKGQKGKIELAKGGTILLDEITELTSNCQAKLLRLIEEREYYRVGGLKKYSTYVRFICATNQDIKSKISKGSFRRDLFYRLNVGHIIVPPLRNRREEILPLAQMFLKQAAIQKKNRFSFISTEAGRILEEYSWPGNIRELKNAIERIVLIWDDDVVKSKHLEFLLQDTPPFNHQNKKQEGLSMYNFPLPEHKFDIKKWDLEIVRKALAKHKGNKTDAAKYLGISRKAIYTRLKYLEDYR
ncbi:sigma-54-dependent transcriptional regulator [candidate division KSB1 bacterium]